MPRPRSDAKILVAQPATLTRRCFRMKRDRYGRGTMCDKRPRAAQGATRPLRGRTYGEFNLCADALGIVRECPGRARDAQGGQPYEERSQPQGGQCRVTGWPTATLRSCSASAATIAPDASTSHSHKD